MGILFRYEMKKLLNRKLVWLLLAVCVGIIVNFDWGMLPRQDNVRGMRDVYAKYEGSVLTDAVAAEARADFERFAAAHPEQFETDDMAGGLAPTGQNGYFIGAWNAYMAVAQGTTAEKYREMAARYQGYLDAGSYENGKPLTQDDRSELKKEITVLGSVPPVVHYAEGWRLLDLCNQDLGIFPLFLLALCLAPLFSGERGAKMEGVLLCAAKRGRAAAAKLLTAFSVTLALVLLFYGMQLLILALTCGLDGASVPTVYTNWSYPSYGSTLLGSFAGTALLTLAAMLALAFLAALASAAFRNTLAAMLAYAVLIAAHFVLAGIVSSEVWVYLKGSALGTVSRFIYLLPGNVLYDGSAGTQIGRILADPKYVAFGLALSLAIAAAAAASAWALYFKRRKA